MVPIIGILCQATKWYLHELEKKRRLEYHIFRELIKLLRKSISVTAEFFFSGAFFGAYLVLVLGSRLKDAE